MRLLVPVVVLVLSACGPSSVPGVKPSESPAGYDSPEVLEAAWEVCEGPLREQLLSPSSAEFPPESVQVEASERGDTWYYTVYAQVDAENGFGAVIRHDVDCYVRYHTDAGRWEDGVGEWEVVSATVRE